MIDYQMPVLTEQQKEDLQAECRRLIKESESAGAGYRTVANGAVARIALAALTSEPICFISTRMLESLTEGDRSFGRVWPVIRDELSGEERIPLHITPPVPVIKQEGEHRD